MMVFKYFLMVICTLYVVDSIAADENHKIVAYWGQNGVYKKHKEPQFWEKDLTKFCQDYNYDVINLAFMNTFFSTANKDRFPGLNFAHHCPQSVSDDYPSLLRCPKIEEGIKECQKRGKKVLLSLGGENGKYGFDSKSEAMILAYRIYHLFLEGNDLEKLRPFGKAILDGIDLNIEKLDSQENKYYTHFVKELRKLEKEGKRKMMITTAPQCPFPDRNLGPDQNKLLGEVPELIDAIYIQFYNNWCQSGNEKLFEMRFRQWMGFVLNHNGPLVYIGLPADEKASGNDKHYRKHKEFKILYKKLSDVPKFGGVMLWDASFDQNSQNDGHMRYSEYIKTIMTSNFISTIPPTVKASTVKHTTVKNDNEKVSCRGNRFGLFQHPTSCNHFIQCAHFFPHVKQCPSGLYFNPTIKVCDWPRNVECNKE